VPTWSAGRRPTRGTTWGRYSDEFQTGFPIRIPLYLDRIRGWLAELGVDTSDVR
jgi:hypothetical protein